MSLRFDVDGGKPPRRWIGLTQSQAHEALAMLGNKPAEAAALVSAASDPNVALARDPTDRRVWVAVTAAEHPYVEAVVLYP